VPGRIYSGGARGVGVGEGFFVGLGMFDGRIVVGNVIDEGKAEGWKDGRIGGTDTTVVGSFLKGGGVGEGFVIHSEEGVERSCVGSISMPSGSVVL